MASTIPGQPFTISAGAQRKIHVTATKTVNGTTTPLVHPTLSGQVKIGNSNFTGVICSVDPTDPDVLIMKNPASTAPASSPQAINVFATALDPVSNVAGSESFTATQLPKPTITVTIANIDEEEPIPTP